MPNDQDLPAGQNADLDERSTQPTPAQIPPGKLIGNYRVLQKVGEGGMGEVYEAEQERPVRRRVALKLIKAGMDTEHVVARFESERQALALMDHPGIAKVLDAGSTDRGRPYFVMEYVRGIPITRYCDTHRLATSERLELFIQVCEAVQHAHQKGIIHRDIKPSNVLVSIQGERPVPRIIDFGVAKATERRLTDRTFFTELGQLVGTPEYMSPEQAEMSGLDVDTRTDVYSLGVMLYELLAGALPFDSGAFRAGGIDEIRRRIREEEPVRPSTRVSTLDDPPTAAARRRTDPSSLVHQLRGDLDWIVMKAMEKDRTRRYPSVSELAADIRRHTRHEPVVAGPPSTPYRVRKFVRRHRVAVIAGAAVTLALVLGIAGTTIGLVRARSASDRAREEAETAKQVSDFLVNLFAVSDPSQARGSTITAREILEKGATKIDAELADQPQVQARLMQTMGAVHRNLGLYGEAERLLERAADLQSRLHGGGDPAVARVLIDLAWVYRAQARFADAESLCRRAVEIIEDAPGLPPTVLVRGLNSLGTMVRDRGDYARAREVLERGLAIGERTLGPEHVDMSGTLYQLGWLHRLLGDPPKAREYLERALVIMERNLGKDHLQVAWCLNDLAVVLRDMGDYPAAMSLRKRSLEIWEKALGPEHPWVADGLNNLGVLLWSMKDYAAAEPYYRRALEIREKVLGPDHPEVASTLNNLGLLYLNTRDHPNAYRCFRRAVAIKEKVYGRGHPDCASAIGNLANVLEEVGEYPDALRLAERAVEILEGALGRESGSSDLATGLHNLGYVRRSMGDFAEARSCFERALAIREKTLGPSHLAVADNLQLLANVCHYLGRDADADSLYRRALAVLEEHGGNDHKKVAYERLALAQHLVSRGDRSGADSLYASAGEGLAGTADPADGEINFNQACFWALGGDRERALEHLRRAVAAGYRLSWIARDPDLASLHADPDFAALVAEIERRLETDRDEIRRIKASLERS
jgi:non-specific serine/threonine protein kinase/serine/threonine-protein kinase